MEILWETRKMVITPEEVVARINKILEEWAAEEKAEAEQLSEKLKSCMVMINAKAGSGGRLFGSVTASEVSENLKKQFGIEIDRHKIVMTDNIKAFGTYELKVKLYNDVAGSIFVTVKEA